MKDQCPEYSNCVDRRVSDAEHRGKVEATLDSINAGVKGLWDAMEVNRKDIKSLYFKIGLISGGTSLIVSLVVSLIFKTK